MSLSRPLGHRDLHGCGHARCGRLLPPPGRVPAAADVDIADLTATTWRLVHLHPGYQVAPQGIRARFSMRFRGRRVYDGTGNTDGVHVTQGQMHFQGWTAALLAGEGRQSVGSRYVYRVLRGTARWWIDEHALVVETRLGRLVLAPLAQRH